MLVAFDFFWFGERFSVALVAPVLICTADPAFTVRWVAEQRLALFAARTSYSEIPHEWLTI
jgi:hypothetical protein